MILATVTGTLFATRKNARFEGKKILVVQPRHLDGSPQGATFLAVDRVNAGIGDQVIINKEGSSARLLFGDEEIPLQSVIIAVVDEIQYR
ncbi:MAG: EutN/CcmL family microcompartment protein [Planctomycetota bacterium]